MLVRFAGSLEPQRGTVGFQANEAERRASIQLAEVAGKADAEWRDLLFRPPGELPQPTRSSEGSRLFSCGVGVQFTESLPDRLRFLRITTLIENSGGHPISAWRSRIVLFHGLHNRIISNGSG